MVDVGADLLYWLSGSKYLPGAPAVLTAFSAGPLARQLAKLSDAALEAYLLDTLRRMLPLANVPNTTTGFARSNWLNEPYTRGCWSNFGPGASPNEEEGILQGPIGSSGTLNDSDARLFFAGEHTSRWYYGTVHGAYYSGQAAADAICAAKIIAFDEEDEIAAAGDDPADSSIATDDGHLNNSTLADSVSSAIQSKESPRVFFRFVALLATSVSTTLLMCR